MSALRKEEFSAIAKKYQQKLVANLQEQGYIRLMMQIVGADDESNLAKQLNALKEKEALFHKMINTSRTYVLRKK